MRSHSIRFCAVFTMLATAGVALTTLGCGADTTDPVADDPTAVTEQSVTYPWPLYSVVPIYFVPKDWSISSSEVAAERAAIDAAMQQIRTYYQGKLGGRTFVLDPVQLVQANSAKEAYGITWTPGGNIYEDGVQIGGSFEGAVVSELHTRGYPTPPAQNESGYSAVVFVKGAGGHAGSRAFSGADGGWSILGDWAIDSLQGAPEVAEGVYWWSGPRKQKGAVAHELGHSFALLHPPAGSESTTIMGNWWDYPNIGFSSSDKTTLLVTKAKFFPAAELAPTPITYSPAAFAPGATVTFDSGVSNTGSVGTGGFNVKWFIDGVQVGYGSHAGIPANTTVLNGNSALAWTATAGTHTIRFDVDVDGHVVELNEANNSTSITVASALADLSPTAITHTPSAIVPGAAVTFDSGVRNSGSVGTGGFNVKWFIDGVQVGYGSHAGVPANTTVLNGNSAFVWTAKAGAHSVQFSVDVDGHVAESNESNNSTKVTVTVP